MPKVLCFHPALAPYRVDFFNLLAEKVDLEVVFLRENLENQKFDQQKLRSQAKFAWRLLTNGFDVKSRYFRFGMTKIVREVRPDVVLSYEASPITAYLCLLRRFAPWRLWTSMDEAAVTIASRTGVRAFVRDWVLRHVDGVIVPSAAAADAYRQVLSHKPTKKVPAFAVVPIIHDEAVMRKNEGEVLARGRIWRERNVPAKCKKVLMFVGRLAKVKNLDWLVEQMKSSASLSEHGLVLVGEGPESAALDRQISESGLSGRVIKVGRKEGEDLYAVMSAADALVLPSVFEPYGAVVAEALQWGVPCVVRDACGSAELITQWNGRVFHDASDFADAVQQTLFLRREDRSLLAVRLKEMVDNLVEVMA